jgi:serine/threonine protein kinase
MKIAHYDLKPTNILVGHDQCVKLTDFDLARNVHEPISSSVVGTLRYLPPECFRPNFGDCQGTAEKADIWMVGVVYCVMLWGKHPIISDKASHEEARSTLARYNGTLSYQRPVTDLSRWIIQGCMHPDPRCRPTAFQLLQALESASQAHHSS